MRPTNTLRALGLGVMLAAAAHPAAALEVTPETDAFTLAGALPAVSSGGITLTGNFVEVGSAPAGQGAIGTFTDGLDDFGLASGVVLATGNVAGYGSGVPATASTDFGWTPSAELGTLLAQAFGSAGGFFDAAWLSLTVDPGLEADFINFDLVYGTNEFGAMADRFAVFTNGTFLGYLAGQTMDHTHTWSGVFGTSVGLATGIYPGGALSEAPLVRLSVPVPQAASAFTLDLIVADTGDGNYDTAAFVGNFSGSVNPLGETLTPVPEVGFHWLAVALLVGLGYRHWRGRAVTG